ncbi:MAG: DEAD/DEAH box helicase [Cyclobacteriaceae bacterium]
MSRKTQGENGGQQRKMIDKQITIAIGKAIREGKYLNITYKNKNGEITPFWICILDINALGELRVDMFNVTKDNPILDGKIFISGIQSAEILKFSHYDVPEALIAKLEHDDGLQVFDFYRYDNNVLNYYLECYKANRDPFLHKAHLIPGLDLPELLKKSPYSLTNEQQEQIIAQIFTKDYKPFHDYELALCEFSIDLISKGKFVVAFRKLKFDPVRKTLHLEGKAQFNPTFYIKGVRHSLSYYTDLSQADFEAMYNNNKAEAIERLWGSFNEGELPNTRPELVVLGYSQIDIAASYDNINADHQNNELKIPIKAFFQNLSLLDRKNRKEPHIVLYDNQINIDQLRTVYNALKYPITYVQGPPGTGKTQTLLNIIVNCLTNGKTLLISSNNNVPIDGIKDKLYLGKYRDKDILLPVIRLGNNEYVAKALKTINELFMFETKDVPKEQLLFNLKEKSKENNKALLDKLKKYEDRLDLQQNLDFVNALLAKGTNHLLEKEKQILKKRLDQIPEIDNDDFKNIYEVIHRNHQLLQFFYFESLRCVKRLKTKDYRELIDILYSDDKEAQVKEFNKWIAEDENLEKFTRAFPVVLTTNLSSRKLGRNYKFDLLAIDEAGQCDIATSLIPISKCKNMVLIGDTNQLQPIVLFEPTRNEELMVQFTVEEPYDYYQNSVLSTYKRIDNISRDILLSYHYRCGKKIINYSNMRFYENRLNLSMLSNIGEVRLIDVNNITHKLKNSNLDEANAVVKYIKDNKLTDAYIITPFRSQEDVINHYLQVAKEKGEVHSSVSCGTIHKVQGQENKTIIMSTSLSRDTTPRTYDWVKNNSQLINVGVTRAKEKLIVFTDKKAIDTLSRKDDDLYALIEYVEKNGTTEVAQSVVNRFTIGFSNNSIFEDEFYKTMSHYCSVQGTRFERNVKLIDLFPEEINNTSVNTREFDGVIYVGKVPQVVFEVNGMEHYSNKKRMAGDKIKEQLLKKKNLKLISIPNQYVKHYEFIRELINKIKGARYQQTLLDV